MTDETTHLSPAQEAAFLEWVQQNKSAPGVGTFEDAPYDMRGFWQDKKARGSWTPGEHFPDTYKQHGHPSFSVESKYSRGLQDGGQWLGETLIQPPMPSHDTMRRKALIDLISKGGKK